MKNFTKKYSEMDQETFKKIKLPKGMNDLFNKSLAILAKDFHNTMFIQECYESYAINHDENFDAKIMINLNIFYY